MTNVTDDVTDDIFWIEGTRMPWFNTRLGHLKKERSIHLIYVLYILYTIYIVNNLYLYYISIYCIYMKGQKCMLYK